MIIWGNCNRDRSEGAGRFTCPACKQEADFRLIRTWKYLHLYFIPVAKQELLAERIECCRCASPFSITVLARTADEVETGFEFHEDDVRPISENFGNVVKLTASAVKEIHQRLAKARFQGNVAVRVEPDDSEHWKIKITFDIPLADGRDWIGESLGVTIIVDRTVAPELKGCSIDYRDGEFVRK